MAEPQYSDDSSISDSADLWRRIHPSWVVRDDNNGHWRVSSAAFDDSPDGSPLSMLLAELFLASGQTASNVILAFEGYSLASLKAESARAQRQAVCRTPTDDEPAHVSVAGSKTKAVKRALARASSWVILHEPIVGS